MKILKAKALKELRYKVWWDNGNEETISLDIDTVFETPTTKQTLLIDWFKKGNKADPYMWKWEKDKLNFTRFLKERYIKIESFTILPNGAKFANTRRTKQYLFTEVGTNHLLGFKAYTLYDILKKPFSFFEEDGLNLLRLVTSALTDRETEYESDLREVEKIQSDEDSKKFQDTHIELLKDKVF